MLVKAGQILVITDGEYSDYCLRGTMKALKDFDVKELRAKFEEQQDWDKDYYRFAPMFLAWLIREGIAEPTSDGEVVELYVGESGTLNPYVQEHKNDF